MEVLINVIIILVIIFAIMKRMQDVARKGGDITGHPTAPPMSQGWPERPVAEEENFPEEEEGPFEEPYRRPEPNREMRPVETPRRTFAEKVLKYEEEKKEAYFASPETEKSGEYKPEVRPVSRAAGPSQGKVMRHAKGEFSICPVLTTCKSELVRGIILSEILGKPIALRRENRW
jgi:hypothetical protein